jgi:hypothetical protein
VLIFASSMNHKSIVCFIISFVFASICFAQELEPRRWTHLPSGLTVVGGGYVRTEGDIFLSPVMNIEDAVFSMDSYTLKLVHAFNLLGRSAQISVKDAYHIGRWDGIRNGAQLSTERDGFSDPVIRIAVNFFGAPALKGAEFQNYRKTHSTDTIVGAAVILQLPFGEYMDDKLINLGSNRYTIRPQLGVVHSIGRWMAELSGSIWFFGDNDDYWDGQELKQDPLFTVQAHSIYTFKSKIWLSGSLGYGRGEESIIDGLNNDDQTKNIAWAVAMGLPVSRKLGFKVIWISKRTQDDIGFDSDTLAIGASYIW